MVEKTEDFLTEKGRSVAIKRCTCYSLFQDKKYGVGLRLHNRKAKGTTSWRCTVCGKEK